ncbi:MAG TPA: hypothetical protein VFO34_05000 [Candidatus Acidoferrales bacterium]|nr:hypothetical protein [Candidatus Acidoferrales bacterium]
MPKLVQTTGLILILLLGVAVTCSAATTGANAPLGVIVIGQKAMLGSVPIADGTSLFDGDTVSTQDQGSLRISLGAAQVWLGQNSALSLHKTATGVEARLETGMMRFSGAAGAPLEFRVLDALVRPKQPTAAGQLAVITPTEFQVGSTSGTLTVDVDGDVRTVEESTAYDATLSSADPQMPQVAGRRHFILLWVIISLIAFGTVFAILHARMSPSHMH